MKLDSYGFPPVREVPASEALHFLIAADGRPFRQTTYRTRDAADRAAKLLARFAVGVVITVYEARPATAFLDDPLPPAKPQRGRARPARAADELPEPPELIVGDVE